MKIFWLKSVIFMLIVTIVFCCNNFFVRVSSENLVEYKGEIEHLFTHCLLAFPSLALNPKNPLSTAYDRDCLTPTEFKNLLNTLYNKNYMLVDIESIYEVKQDQVVQKTLYLPKGKKPLILSFDDVNYDSKKKNSGMVDKLILDQNNNIASYHEKTKTISYDNEFLPILENFIKTYPDFSFKGARGVLCLTGYDGILGYKTQRSNPNYKEEIKKVTPLVNRLKSLGWKFACHSYGHYHMKQISEYEFFKEIVNWQTEVEPIIGKTNIYVYPYGEWEIYDSNFELTKKHKMLLDAGFRFFLGVGAKNFFNHMPLNSQQKHTLFMDRKPIDGRTLRTFEKYYNYLFDAKEIYDNKNRTVKLI